MWSLQEFGHLREECPDEDPCFMETYHRDEVESPEQWLRLKTQEQLSAQKPEKGLSASQATWDGGLDVFLAIWRTKVGVSPVESLGTRRCAAPFRVKRSCHLPEKERGIGVAAPRGRQPPEGPAPLSTLGPPSVEESRQGKCHSGLERGLNGHPLTESQG
ncbi:UNVERIFIED_CONTAM: hypothetical protein FKN15_072857 [Acipenser sinensis]